MKAERIPAQEESDSAIELPGNHSVTIRDVARLSGVSVTTTSVVLNNSNRPVNAVTRARVLEVAQRLGYHPNAIARGLVRRRSHILGVRFGWVEPAIITNPYAGGVLQGVIDAASYAGYRILLHTEVRTEGSSADDPNSVSSYRDGVSDGLVIIAPLTDSPVMSALVKLGLPLVAVSYPSEPLGIASVDVDNRAGAVLAARHLLALGHTRIAHIMGNYNLQSVPERRDGFLAALSEAGIVPPKNYIAAASYDPRSGYAVASRLLSLPDRPTAIFAGSDELALGVMEAARARGLRVPEDLSVIGFDDTQVARLASPPLTTVKQPLREMGAVALRTALRLAAGETVDSHHVELATTLIVRDSATAIPCE